MFRIHDGILNHILQKNFEHTSSLFVHESRDAFDTAPPSQSSNGWFGDALDIVSQEFTVTFAPAFAESFPSFPTASTNRNRHERSIACLAPIRSEPTLRTSCSSLGCFDGNLGGHRPEGRGHAHFRHCARRIMTRNRVAWYTDLRLRARREISYYRTTILLTFHIS